MEQGDGAGSEGRQKVRARERRRVAMRSLRTCVKYQGVCTSEALSAGSEEEMQHYGIYILESSLPLQPWGLIK